MKGGQLPTNQLHNINWGALDRASRAPQLMSCKLYVRVCVCVHTRVCMYTKHSSLHVQLKFTPMSAQRPKQ